MTRPIHKCESCPHDSGVAIAANLWDALWNPGVGEDAASAFTTHLYHNATERRRKNTEWGEVTSPHSWATRCVYRLAGDVVTIVQDLLDVVHVPVVHRRITVHVS